VGEGLYLEVTKISLHIGVTSSAFWSILADVMVLSGAYLWIFVWVAIPFAALQKNNVRATNNRIFIHCSLAEEVGSPTHILHMTSLG
jgi:hypothetical protein